METRAKREPGPPSERSFGVVIAAFLAVLALLPLLSGGSPHLPLVIAAAICALLTLAAPGVLRPFNLIWYRLGLLLNRIVSPIVMGAAFFVVVTPIGLVARAAGRNLLDRRRPERPSYWHPRSEDASKRGSMRDQF